MLGCVAVGGEGEEGEEEGGEGGEVHFGEGGGVVVVVRSGWWFGLSLGVEGLSDGFGIEDGAGIGDEWMGVYILVKCASSLLTC